MQNSGLDRIGCCFYTHFSGIDGTFIIHISETDQTTGLCSQRQMFLAPFKNPSLLYNIIMLLQSV